MRWVAWANVLGRRGDSTCHATPITQGSRRCRRRDSRRRHQRLIATLRLLAALDECDRIELLVPACDHPQHLHPVLLHLALPEQSNQSVTQLPNPKMQHGDPPIPDQAANSVMLVKIAV